MDSKWRNLREIRRILMVLGIYGAGGLGREVLELAKLINEKENRWDDIVFIIDGDGGNIVNGTLVYSYDDALAKYESNIEVSMGIGEPAVREKLFGKLEADGIPVATLIHPDVHVPETTVVGKGVTIQFGSFVSCNVVIEDYVFVQPQVNIGHNDVLKKGCIVSGLCNLAGNVVVGEYAYLGISSCYREGISIGAYSIVSMGAVVFKDIPEEMVAMGNPARPMRKNEDKRVFK